MIFASAVIAALFLSLGAARAPSSSAPIVHESRSNVPAGWTAVRRADPGMILPFRIGLAQPNLDNIEAFLMDVSHPESPNYGKHWSPAKVAATFRPSNEAVDTVRTWLVDSGLSEDRVRLSTSGGWLHANVTIEEAERLLGTEYYVYQHSDDEDLEHIACHEKYHLPEQVSKHVEIVTPTLHFDVKPRRVPVQVEKLERRSSASSSAANAHAIGQPGFGTSFLKTKGTLDVSVHVSYGVCGYKLTYVVIG